MTNFLLHTDFGHDPDDAIALAYLIEHNHIPSTINIVPGFWKQEQILSGFMDLYISYVFNNINYCKPAQTINQNKEKKYDVGKHKIFINGSKRIFFPYDKKYSMSDSDFVFNKALVIGPPKGLANNLECEELFFQGGYSPNSIDQLDKFKGEQAIQSFNPNGAKEDFNYLIETNKIKRKYFIGKNVCHGFTKSNMSWSPKNPIVAKFWNELSDNKAMHDVLAAMLFINKDLGIWEQAKPYWLGNKLTTVPTTENIFTLIGVKK